MSFLGLDLHAPERLTAMVADLSLARALYEGSPAARLLARTRLGSDECELLPSEDAVSPWDGVLRGLADEDRALRERTKRAVARHARAASDEGALHAPQHVLAAMVAAVAAGEDPDASMAEIASGPGSLARVAGAPFARRAAAYDSRLDAGGDLRLPLFEACVWVAARAHAGPWSDDLAHDGFALLAELAAVGETLPRPLPALLYPRDIDEQAVGLRRLAVGDRAELEPVALRDARELAVAMGTGGRNAELRLDTFVADIAKLLSVPGLLVLATVPASPAEAGFRRTASLVPSWVPQDWSASETAGWVAEALERGLTTVPRVRVAIARGGDAAMDQIGAEMLQASLHPFASGAFAEILAHSARPRDVMRLVTYFAIAPDPEQAARALGACPAADLPRVLAAWLEAMLPADGAATQMGTNPDTSSGARLATCVAALRPYPHLFEAVAPLMGRVSESR